MFEHKADYADAYFQYTRNESFSLEEGIVKSGSFDIEQGVGVRAVAGDKTAFSYSDDITADALHEAALRGARDRRARAAASRACAERSHARACHALYGLHDPVASLDAAAEDPHARAASSSSRARATRA